MASSEIHLIALKLVKYSDRQSILTAYSLEAGCVSFAIPMGAGKAASRTRALTMPLSILTAVADVEGKREIPPLRNPVPSPPLCGVNSSPLKQMIAMFVAELLSVLLKESQPDEAMFRFLVSSIRILDCAVGREVANFPLAFLYNLARQAGIEPDRSTYRAGRVFDMRDGLWRDTVPVAHHDYLGTEESRIAATVSRITMENMGKFDFSRAERNRALDLMLEYYTMHYVSLRNLKSLDVLRSFV